jgi:hypothetical protein
MPKDFPSTPYEGVHFRVNNYSRTDSESWIQYNGAWKAISYRFLSVVDYDKAFTRSIKKFGDAPPNPERYKQERDLFGFFVNGLAAIESLYYAVFAIGSMLEPVNFNVDTPQDLRSINPESTNSQFKKVFPEESFNTILSRVTSSPEFRAWKEVRNILAHREAPGRTIFLSNSGSSPAALWKVGIPLDANTTASRRKWLAETLGLLIKETDIFTSNRFP